jgi:hypothetical protein
MRSKKSHVALPPLKYRKYVSGDWPGGCAQWCAEREEWNAAQEPVLYAGTSPAGAGLSWSYLAGPLGDQVDLFRARREARLMDAGDSA